VAGFLGGPSLTADKLELHQFASGLRLEVALARGAPAVLGRFAAHRTVRGGMTRVLTRLELPASRMQCTRRG
jgi:hypothetical protein